MTSGTEFASALFQINKQEFERKKLHIIVLLFLFYSVSGYGQNSSLGNFQQVEPEGSSIAGNAGTGTEQIIVSSPAMLELINNSRIPAAGDDERSDDSNWISG